MYSLNIKEGKIMKSVVIASLFSGMFLLSSCATISGKHHHTRGSVVALDSEEEAHVCLGEKEIKPGDRLSVYESVCKSEISDDGPRVAIRRTTCERIARGEVEVVENSGSHFSKVRALSGLKLKEGFILEKKIN